MPAPTVVGTNVFCGERLRLGMLGAASRDFSALAGEFSICGEWQAG